MAISPTSVSAEKGSIVAKVALGKLPPGGLDAAGAVGDIPTISGGMQQAALALFDPADKDVLINVDDEKAVMADAPPAEMTEATQFSVSGASLGCRNRNSNANVRVNQDCTFRRQAEELIKINPVNSLNIIAGQNDSRIGYNKCGFDYSLDGGGTWGDGIPPFYQKENRPENDGPTAANPNRNTILGGQGTHHTYDAGSDPALAFDSAGRAFFSCVLFDVNTNASGILVTSSPEGAGGSFYNNVAPAGRNFVVVEDNAPNAPHAAALHDKEFITADTFTGSPNRDNVYITWTMFLFKDTCRGAKPLQPTQCSSAIFGSVSTNHGLTWSTPDEISGSSPLCFQGNVLDPSRSEHDCVNNQGSDPIVLPDGDLAVVFNNSNTAATDPNRQQLAVHCHPTGKSESGTAQLNCAPPSRVGTDFRVGEPRCNFGRGAEECIPGPFIRTNDFPRVAIDTSNGALFAVWQDYRNKEFDIASARSNDGGTTWQEGGRVNSVASFDNYMPAIGVGTDHTVAVSFYQSVRVPGENTMPTHGPAVCGTGRTQCFAQGDPGVGTSDSTYWLAGRQQPGAAVRTPFTQVQLSPVFPPPDGNQLGFNGDYSGLAVQGTTAHPIWSDTRNTAVVTSPSQGVVHDEDIFTDARPIPAGGAGGDEGQAGPGG